MVSTHPPPVDREGLQDDAVLSLLPPSDTAGMLFQQLLAAPRERLWDRWEKLQRATVVLRENRRPQTASRPGAPFVVAVINQKGGTGKTTTTINLSAALAYKGYAILMVDLDPQGHTTIGIGIDPDAFLESMAEVMSIPRKPVADIVLPTYIPQLFLAPARIHLAHVAEQVYTRVFREAILHQALQNLPYDFIFIDCPPSLGVLTINALYACNFLIIPCQISRYSLDGLADLLYTVEMVKNLTPQELMLQEVFRILLTMYDKRNRVTNEYILEEIRPYKNHTFQSIIMRSESLNQAQIEQKAIFDFDPQSSGSQDYQQLAGEFLQLYHRLTGASGQDQALPTTG